MSKFVSFAVITIKITDMLTVNEAKSLAKSIYLKSAALSGFDISEKSPYALTYLVEQSHSKIDGSRRPEAVANMLKLIAATLEEAQKRGDTWLGENSIDRGSEKVCPIYPFD